MTTTANIQSNGNGAVQNINMTEEGTMNRENNNINMVTRLSNNVRMGSISKIIGTAVLGLALTVSLAMPGGARADVPAVSSASSTLFDNLNDDFSLVYGMPDAPAKLKASTANWEYNDDFSLVYGMPDAPAKLKTASISGVYNDDFSMVYGIPDNGPGRLGTNATVLAKAIDHGSEIMNDDFSMVYGMPDNGPGRLGTSASVLAKAIDHGSEIMNDDFSMVYGTPDSVA